MPDFKYTALDKAGQEVTGTLTGRDLGDAAVKVRQLGYFPVDVAPSGNSQSIFRSTMSGAGMKPRAAESSSDGVAPAGKKVGRVQILLFTRELADLIDAGLPIDRCLSVLIEQSDSEQLKAMVAKIQGDVRSGKPLSDGLRNFPREFPPLYANMIRAGEISGQLSSVMTRLADFLEKEQIRRSQVIAALTYPAVLVTIALLAVTFLLTFVIPKLQQVFKDLGAALPVPTQILLSVSSFVTHYWYVILLGIAAAWFIFKGWTNTNSGRRAFDSFRLSVPLFGGLNQKITMSRFVRTLGTLLGGGVAILESLEISGTAVGNSVTSTTIMDVRDRVRQGETLAVSMESAGGYLPIVMHMTAVGEETGRLSQMLIRTADTLDFEVDNMLRRLTSLVEPLVVLLMGGFVGFVVISILLPIFQASNIVK